MLDDFTGNDVAAACCLSFLSFLASILLGTTSLGDGIVLQITWGILQQLWPYATTESGIGPDGMRMITLLMFVRLVLIPPYLLWKLWVDHKDRVAQTAADYDAKVKAYEASIEDAKLQQLDGGVVSKLDSYGTVVASSPESPPTPPAVVPIFSMRLFLLILIPNTFWCIMGVFVLQKAKSDEIAIYSGILFIAFSLIYAALKAWKTSSLRKSMPPLLQSILSPAFFTEGSNSDLTIHAQISAFIAFNLVGIMTTLTGIGGPPMMLFVLLYEVPMNMTRFSIPFGTITGATIRLVFSIYSGLLPARLWPYFIPAIIAGIVGIKVGVGIGNVLTPSMFAATIFCLLLLAGIVMLTSNILITGPSLVIAVSLLAYKFLVLEPREAAVAAAKAAAELSKVGSPSDSGADRAIVSLYEVKQIVVEGIAVPHDDTTGRIEEEDLDRSSKYCETEALGIMC